MAYFKIINFSGIAPQVSPRLLAEDMAQTAIDVNLESGRLVPVTDNSTSTINSSQAPTASTRTSIYKYDYDSSIKWLEWTEDVDVVPGPVAGNTEDRLYWTGEDFPRMSIDASITSGSAPWPTTSYRLGVPAPTDGQRPTANMTASDVPGSIFTFNSESTSVVVIDSASPPVYTNSYIVLTTAQWDSLADGDGVLYNKGDSDGGVTPVDIAGLDSDTGENVYFVIKGTTPRIRLAISKLDAAAPIAVAMTAVGTGDEHTLTKMDDDTQTAYTTSYIFTLVSPFGEEGPPSLPSAEFTKVDGQTIQVGMGGAGAQNEQPRMSTWINTHPSGSGSGTAKKRLYRSNTGSNTTAFQFVADVAIASATYDDSKDNSELAELIPSTYWIGPPDEVTADYPEGPMKGLTAMPGGILAGFTGKRLCFSEPFLPHAWPVSYRLTLEEEIVSIGMAGNGLIVTTKGTPYLVGGADPRSMSVTRIEAAQACLNKRSLVDMGPYVMWAGADGLIMAAGTEVSVATEGLLTPKQWLADYYPTTLKGYLWQGRYVGLYTSGSNKGGFIFDPRAQKNAFVELTQGADTDAAGGFTDPDDNELYILTNQASGNDIIQKFQGSATNKTFTWKSKEFVVRKPTSMGFLKVDTEAFPVTLKVYGDGTLFYTGTIALSGTQHSVSGSYVNAGGSTVSISSTNIPEPVVRLPARTFNTFSIEISSATIVNEVCIAESIDEIRGL